MQESLPKIMIDTTTLEGKRAFILNEYQHFGVVYDTLLDLNFDDHQDYVIGFYASAGTGIKNRVAVCLFDSLQNRYISNEQLSAIPNPTFYLKKKKITGFYIGNGGGEGEQLEWMDGKWTTTKTFSVENLEDKTRWKINFSLTGKKEERSMPFQMIPPQTVLETSIE